MPTTVTEITCQMDALDPSNVIGSQKKALVRFCIETYQLIYIDIEVEGRHRRFYPGDNQRNELSSFLINALKVHY